jgi:hypothetical protein
MRGFNELERKAILLFEKWYRDGGGPRVHSIGEACDYLSIDEREYHVLMDRLGDLCIVEEKSLPSRMRTLDDPACPYAEFTIDSRVCDDANDIRREEQEKASARPPDLVDGIIHRARSHPILSIAILLTIGFAFVLSLVNGAFDLLENIAQFWSP